MRVEGEKEKLTEQRRWCLGSMLVQEGRKGNGNEMKKKEGGNEGRKMREERETAKLN